MCADRFAANKAAAKAVEKAAKQADSARRREEVQQKFGAMTEEERNIWRTERQAKRQNRKSETGEKRARLQQVRLAGHALKSDALPRRTSIFGTSAILTASHAGCSMLFTHQ